MLMVGIGLVIGVAGALAVTRILSGLLFGVTPTDVPTYIAVSVLLAAVALTACAIPARRAMRRGSDRNAALRVVNVEKPRTHGVRFRRPLDEP